MAKVPDFKQPLGVSSRRELRPVRLHRDAPAAPKAPRIWVRAVCAAGLCAALAWTDPAVAQGSHNGHYLHNLCRNSRAACQGYVAAVVDVMSSLAYLHGFRACVPQGVNDAQMAEVVARWLAAHARMRGDRADILVARSLAEAFPCR